MSGGRPPFLRDRTTVNIMVERPSLEAWKSYAEGQGLSLSALIREVMDRVVYGTCGICERCAKQLDDGVSFTTVKTVKHTWYPVCMSCAEELRDE